MIKKIVNSIFKYETCYINSFFEKKPITKKMEKRINKIRDLLTKCFSGEFEYNYIIDKHDMFDFYIFNNNELYKYSILFKYKKLLCINLIEKYIIKNSSYYIQIEYYESFIYLSIFKYISLKHDRKLILYKQYYKDKILGYHQYKNEINKYIIIENNNIKDIYYYSNKFKKGNSKYKYVYNNKYIYIYRGFTDYYSSKFGRTYRSFLLFI